MEEKTKNRDDPLKISIKDRLVAGAGGTTKKIKPPKVPTYIKHLAETCRKYRRNPGNRKVGGGSKRTGLLQRHDTRSSKCRIFSSEEIEEYLKNKDNR